MQWEGILDGEPDTPGVDPYKDISDYWTIGYGHLIVHEGRALQGERDRALAMSLYPNGLTKEQCLDLLVCDIKTRRKQVRSALKGYEFTDAQFDAICSLVFNIGIANIKTSTLLRCHKAGIRKPRIKTREEGLKASKARQVPDNAPDEFLMWTMARQGGKLTWTQGLFNRRWEERERYLNG